MFQKAPGPSLPIYIHSMVSLFLTLYFLSLYIYIIYIYIIYIFTHPPKYVPKRFVYCLVSKYMQIVSQIELVRWSTLQLKLAQFIFLERLVRHTSNGATEQNSFHEAVHVYTHITLQATNFRHFSRACRSKSECEISFVSPLVWSR
jgi:hypothetical protein